ncbi:Glutamate 5-kinase [Polynucleobacter antarcticus]|uniref:Glutamate 5-kinase n=1 Tax=Polynucleobacter antarcticus TaxID=1743162 RepID=A0A6M9PSL6_9BURK|nr:glutamate 5-kinase [Polynucleobacter antarcticus]
MDTQKVKRIVVKVGSSLVTNNGEGLDHAAIAMWAEQMAGLLKAGHQVLMVSSGAIAEGMQRLGWTQRPHEIHQLQAAAAVGQMGLVQVYESSFARFNLRSAQVLLTNADLADTERNANAKATLETLLSLGVVPIINENDTVVTDEIKFGDNDNLAALVVNLIHADLLVILTDQGGLFTADPRQDANATLMSDALAGDPALEKMAGGAASQLSKGGMLTKVLAAKVAAQTGATTIIASGHTVGVLTRLMNGEKIGTRLTSGG